MLNKPARNTNVLLKKKRPFDISSTESKKILEKRRGSQTVLGYNGKFSRRHESRVTNGCENVIALSWYSNMPYSGLMLFRDTE